MEAHLPKVTLPGNEGSDAVRELRLIMAAASAQDEHVRAQQKAMAQAMVDLGKPIFRRGKPKRRRLTKNVRQVRRLAARRSREEVN